MSNSILMMSRSRNSLGLTLWLLFAALQGLLLFAARDRIARFDTDLLSLLPATERDPLHEQALTEFGKNIAQRNVFLIGSGDFKSAARAADAFAEALEASDVFGSVRAVFGEQGTDLFYQLYFPFRYQLLSPENEALLQTSDGPERYLKRVQHYLYSPLSGFYAERLAEDPLLLSVEYGRGLLRELSAGQLKQEQQRLTFTADGVTYVFVTSLALRSVFEREEQRLLESALERAEQAARKSAPDVQIQSAGMLHFAIAGTHQAEKEISIVSIGSLLGSILLIVLSFQSFAILMYCMLPVAAGLATAFAVSLQFYDSLHLMTLTMGATLIGACIDYTFHYLVHAASPQLGEEDRVISRIGPALTLGALTTLLGFAAFFAAPSPGLRQMAVFSSAGLIGNLLTVMLLFPSLPLAHRPRHLGLLTPLARGVLGVWSGVRLRGGALLAASALLFVVIGMGLARLSVSDDLRNLQPAQPDLLRQEVFVRTQTKGLDIGRFFLVEGETIEQVLQREEALMPKLQALIKGERLKHVQALSTFLPSIAKQNQNHELLRQAFSSDEKLRELGFSEETLAALRTSLDQPPASYLTLEDFLAAPYAEALKAQWLPHTIRGSASLVLLEGIKDPDELRKAVKGVAGVHFIDKPGSVLKLFEDSRRFTGLAMIAVYIALYFLLALRYGLRQTLTVVLPPLAAAALCLATFGWLGISINLFVLLALVLVLAMGIDFTIFFSELERSGGDDLDTMRSLLLSALTTMISFGLLATSTTPIMRTLGLTVFIGTGLGLLLAPYSRRS